jgi:hypothetical protein
MTKLLFPLLLIVSLKAAGQCQILSSSGRPSPIQSDAHALILSQLKSCPQDVFEYKLSLSQNQLVQKAAMVANRGRNNPAFGSYSLFEEVTGRLQINGANLLIQPGEFFFGHFTKKAGNQIVPDQVKNQGQLMIELIAWDYRKKIFNFYELIGQGGSAKWFYRGDSKDILADNQLLYRTQGNPQFGRTLRCSACHSSGGPIMKELATPHNDWWSATRPLNFGNLSPNPVVAQWLNSLNVAENFSQSIQKGILKLQLSPTYQNLKSSRSLQEQLRPLFCDTEINLESGQNPSQMASSGIKINSSAFLNPFFTKSEITFSKTAYNGFLQKYKLKFPETSLVDADHPWLTPVKGYSDLLAIQILIKKRVIDLEFAYDVLAVDAKESLFSKKRCQLLQLVPQNAMPGWKNQFINNLKSANTNEAQALIANMTDPTRNSTWFIQTGRKYIQELQRSGLEQNLFEKLLKDRTNTFQSEISKNPLGQILEPGFRVIFPIPGSKADSNFGRAF